MTRFVLVAVCSAADSCLSNSQIQLSCVPQCPGYLSLLDVVPHPGLPRVTYHRLMRQIRSAQTLRITQCTSAGCVLPSPPGGAFDSKAAIHSHTDSYFILPALYVCERPMDALALCTSHLGSCRAVGCCAPSDMDAVKTQTLLFCLGAACLNRLIPRQLTEKQCAGSTCPSFGTNRRRLVVQCPASWLSTSTHTHSKSAARVLQVSTAWTGTSLVLRFLKCQPRLRRLAAKQRRDTQFRLQRFPVRKDASTQLSGCQNYDHPKF